MITLEEVKRKVAELPYRHMVSKTIDDPNSHYMEDELYYLVLSTIAAGAENAQELAKETIKTREIKFSRWYE